VFVERDHRGESGLNGKESQKKAWGGERKCLGKRAQRWGWQEVPCSKTEGTSAARCWGGKAERHPSERKTKRLEITVAKKKRGEGLLSIDPNRLRLDR